MITSQQALILKENLLHTLKKLDVAWYIIDEIWMVLDHLNYYKLLNLHKNLESFKEYVLLLDEQNTKEIELLVAKY